MACLTPFTLREKKNQVGQKVPCGKCPECYYRRVSGWIFRLLEEEKISISSHFITLTYDDRFLPRTASGRPTISKRHLQLFIKKLRKCNRKKIKYYGVGEYGGKTIRPHYHLIMFNADIRTIQDSWAFGSVNYGNVAANSIAYTLKYLSKSQRIGIHYLDDRQRNFSLMSKGIGKTYLSRSVLNYHMKSMSNGSFLLLPDGKKVSLPRYYKLKIFSHEQQEKLAEQALAKSLDKLFKEAMEETDKGTSTQNYRDRQARNKAAYARMHRNHTLKCKV